MGIKTELAGMPVRRDTLIRMGISRTTMGTLLMKALAAAPTSRVRSSDTLGLLTQARARRCPDRLQCPGPHQSAACDHKGANGNQGFVTEA